LGTGGEPLRLAANQGTKEALQTYQQYLRGNKTEMSLVDDVQGAVRDLMARRAAEYKQGVAGLDQGIRLKRNAYIQSMMDGLKDYNVALASKNGKPALDFRGSFLGNSTRAADRDLMMDAWKQVSQWRDLTPAGINELRKSIYDMAGSASPQVQPYFYRLGQTITDDLKNRVPGYAELNAKYAGDSDLLNQFKREFSVNPERPGTTVVKLTNALNKPNQYRSLLLDAMDNEMGTNLKSALAGKSMNSWIPRGLQGVLAASPLAAWGYLHNPEALLATPGLSPRTVGEILGGISRLRQANAAAKAANPALYKFTPIAMKAIGRSGVSNAAAATTQTPSLPAPDPTPLR
jgi:hypothetical protein